MCMCIEFVIQVLKQKNAHASFPVGMVCNGPKIDSPGILYVCNVFEGRGLGFFPLSRTKNMTLLPHMIAFQFLRNKTGTGKGIRSSGAVS